MDFMEKQKKITRLYFRVVKLIELNKQIVDETTEIGIDLIGAKSGQIKLARYETKLNDLITQHEDVFNAVWENTPAEIKTLVGV